MKKIFVTLTVALVLISSSIFANTRSNPIPSSVVSAFNENFHHVRQVSWANFGNSYQATFTDKDKTLYVFFSETGDLMGMARNVLSDRLPSSLQNELKTSYKEFWITDLSQYKVSDKDGFLITIENGDRKIVLKSENNQNWQVYSKENKA